MATMRQQFGIDVALAPLFLNAAANARAFGPVGYLLSDWDNRSPAEQGAVAADVSLAHSLGKLWMQPVSIQDERPNQGIYDEADWVQLKTWNSYSEGTQFAPSAHNGYAYLDISAYYLTRFKTGTWPTIVRDTAYLTTRVQPTGAGPAGQSKVMKLRPGSAAPRDDVEILTFLTAPAAVRTTVGTTSGTYDAAAGVQARLLPLSPGASSATVVRGSQTVAQVASASPASAQSGAAQDLQYRATSSRRGPG